MQIVYDHNYIRVIDQFLSSETCREFIANFELCERHHQRRASTQVNLIELDLRNFTHRPCDSVMQQLKLAAPYNWTESTDWLTHQVYAQTELYFTRWAQLEGVHLVPPEFAMEGMRIKCYRPNQQDEFKLHVDVVNAQSATRFLSFLLYLNDSDGSTEFPLENHTIQAREGRLVMFPPLWCYPHRGLMPQDGATKYILSTYLHYI